MADNENKNVKGRDWTFIVYPESAPISWREILNDTHLRWVESPLHDKDINSDGEIKKAHWHILLTYDGPVNIVAVKKITDKLNAPVPQKISSAKGLVRYMIHLDNPEKFQYSRSDIKGHNGADVASYFELTATNKLMIMKDIVRYIYENEVDNYSDFLMHCIENKDDWFDVAINSNTIAINKMIDAVWQKKKK
ncbi:replication protein [Leuconostoc gelidum subsp. gasicomitatum]|uniref:replication protein n=1 Tax=Leuconostoc gasicomitatum TaxID=115778 RepID=UPI001CC66195|nr:replication protein [Leuconostoc gasicomitatum]MBZ5983530.1 replication protein [Leuconostoc gasicomitatum]